MPPSRDPELERLAAKGQQRRAALDQEVNATGQRHLSIAIGAYRGSVLSRTLVAATLVFLVVGGAGQALSLTDLGAIGGYLQYGFAVALLTFMAWVFAPPLASPAAIAAERSWVESLPFALEGYLGLLSGSPSYQRIVRFEIRWREGTRPPEREALESVVRAADPRARVHGCDPTSATFTGGPVSGSTGIRNGRVPVYRNHRLPSYIHAVIDLALLAIHGRHPIASVTVRSK